MATYTISNAETTVEHDSRDGLVVNELAGLVYNTTPSDWPGTSTNTVNDLDVIPEYQKPVVAKDFSPVQAPDPWGVLPMPQPYDVSGAYLPLQTQETWKDDLHVPRPPPLPRYLHVQTQQTWRTNGYAPPPPPPEPYYGPRSDLPVQTQQSWTDRKPPPPPPQPSADRGQLSHPAHQVWENRRPTPPLPEPPLPNTVTSSQDASMTWMEKAVNAAKLDIFTTLTRSGDDKAPKTATLNIAAAQRLLLAYQQREIATVATRLYDQQLYQYQLDGVCDQLMKLIHEHCEAVRDLDFMQQRAADCGENDYNDPFYLKSSKEIDRLAMERAGLIPHHVLPAGNLPIARDHDYPTLPGVARTAAIKADKSRHLLLRFSMASAGGLFLIVPVIVMAFVEGITSSLITTCVAMLIFAIGITFGTDLKADQVLGATAAYAAVLVVFVGTSLANTSA